MEPVKDHPSTHGCLQTSETSHRKSNLGNVPHQYLSELLVNVYSQHLMVKVCLAINCVRHLFSDPITFGK